MIFPLGIRGYCNRKQPAKCHLTDNETVPVKKLCKLVRAIKVKGVKQGLGVEFWNVFYSTSAFLSQVWWEYYCILWRAKIMYVHSFLIWILMWKFHCTLCWCSHAHLLCNSSWQFLARSLQSHTKLHFVFPQHICMFSSWTELNLKVPSHIFENLQNMCIIWDKTSCRIGIYHVCCTWLPRVHCMPWRAQYGRWNFWRNTGEVLQIR